jgi:hypothetical protein
MAAPALLFVHKQHATCADLMPLSKPGVRFEACPPDMRYNPEADESRSPSVDTCCQSMVDVWVKKTVSPSTVQKAGSILLYRLEVGVTSNASHPADTVTMVEAMPEGLELVSVTELPDENGEGRGLAWSGVVSESWHARGTCSIPCRLLACLC